MTTAELVVGDKSKLAFAVTAGTLPLGTIVMWLGGKQIGDDTQPMMLSAGMRALQNFSRSADLSMPASLMSRTDDEILDIVFAEYFGTDLDQEPSESWSKFILCPGLGEGFDGWFVVAFDRGEETVVLWHNQMNGTKGRYVLQLGELQDVVGHTIATLQTLL